MQTPLAAILSPRLIIILLLFGNTQTCSGEFSQVNNTQFSQRRRFLRARFFELQTEEPLLRNIGASFYIPQTTVEKYPENVSSNHPSIPDSVFNDARVGSSFTVHLSATPGSYDVLLAFIQGRDCVSGARVFHVSINGNVFVKNLDVFEKVGCKKPYILQYNNQEVKPDGNRRISVSLKAVSGKAGISFYGIRQPRSQCRPRSSDTSKFNHDAHSDPGRYPPDGGAYIDSKNKGFVTVLIDGSASHTHAEINGRDAKLISYKWMLSNGKVISTSKKFYYRFPIGTTKLRLVVKDEICSTNEATTYVTVTGTRGSGADCYYYPGKSMLQYGGLSKSPFPSLASIQRTLILKVPSALWKSKFAMRCKFFISSSWVNSKMSIDTGGVGTAFLYRGTTKIVDTNKKDVSSPFNAKTGLQAFELLYARNSGRFVPFIRVKLNGHIPKHVSFDHSAVLPILKTITPTSGKTIGGTTIKLYGHGLNPPVTILFGSQKLHVPQNTGSYSELIIKSPKVNRPTTVSVKVQRSKTLVSNGVSYRYGDKCDDIAFEPTYIRNYANKKLTLDQPTALTTAPDGSLYIGTRNGEIVVLKYNEMSMKAISMCTSGIFIDKRLKDQWDRPVERSILGITLDPRDKIPRPYVSVSTIYWNRWNFIVNGFSGDGWANGAIERFKPASPSTKSRFPGRCLEHDRTIAKNLPVANSDHGVNELIFTPYGDLLVGIGSNTNMGLPHIASGGLWETYFSGSVLIIRLSKGNRFNGVVPYNSMKNMRTAKPINGYTDVDIYCTGFRNIFSLIATRNGKVFGVDMGPNCEFGNAAALCSEYKESDAAKRSPKSKYFIGGKATVADRFCKSKFSASRKDKFVEIKQGKFYGQPNLQRAMLRNTPGECAYVDPETGKTAPPLKRSPPSNYQAPLGLLTSPRTGIREYGANCFCGKLRGSIILANHKVQGTHWVRPSAFTEKSAVFQLSRRGGLRVDESIHGDLLFIEYSTKKKVGLTVLRPKVRSTTRLGITNALPFRHGMRGGTLIRIGGTGFSSKSRVLIGGKTCNVVSVSPKAIACKVPVASFKGQKASIIVRNGLETQTLPNAVLYMNV